MRAVHSHANREHTPFVLPPLHSFCTRVRSCCPPSTAAHVAAPHFNTCTRTHPLLHTPHPPRTRVCPCCPPGTAAPRRSTPLQYVNTHAPTNTHAPPTSHTGMPMLSARYSSSTSKHQRCSRWLENSSAAERRVNSCAGCGKYQVPYGVRGAGKAQEWGCGCVQGVGWKAGHQRRSALGEELGTLMQAGSVRRVQCRAQGAHL